MTPRVKTATQSSFVTVATWLFIKVRLFPLLHIPSQRVFQTATVCHIFLKVNGYAESARYHQKIQS
jgi:hypothetical protein